MLRSPIGWRLCNSANSLTIYAAGTELRDGYKVSGEKTTLGMAPAASKT